MRDRINCLFIANHRSLLEIKHIIILCSATYWFFILIRSSIQLIHNLQISIINQSQLNFSLLFHNWSPSTRFLLLFLYLLPNNSWWFSLWINTFEHFPKLLSCFFRSLSILFTFSIELENVLWVIRVYFVPFSGTNQASKCNFQIRKIVYKQRRVSCKISKNSKVSYHLLS